MQALSPAFPETSLILICRRVWHGATRPGKNFTECLWFLCIPLNFTMIKILNDRVKLFINRYIYNLP